MILFTLIIVPIVFILFKVSFKVILKLMVNAIVGFAILFVINSLIYVVGTEIPINWFTSLFVGFVGIPAALILVVYYLWIK